MMPTSHVKFVEDSRSIRSGKVALFALGACVVIASLGLLAMGRFSRTSKTDTLSRVLLHTVESGPFVSLVTEAGDVESASNVEVLCEVKSETGPGSTILELVDDGVVVEEGDFLLQFDDTALQLALTQQEIQVATDTALVIQAQSELDKFQQMLSEYRDGLFVMEKETHESSLLQAESHFESVQDAHRHTRRMFQKGYVSRVQLGADEKAVAMAQKAVEAARTTLKVHAEFTRPRMVSEYEAEIEKQKALLRAAEYTLKLSEQRRDDIREQIDRCRVVAPAAGQVVYRNDYRRRPPFVIEEGVQVRQGQVIFRLPDPTQMQVDINVNDSKIGLVELGDAADIELDVAPDLKVRGEVVEIAPFGRRDWGRGPIRYDALIRVIDPPAAMRPGQRAKVHIYVEEREDAIQAPVQSVVSRDEEHYCLVLEEGESWSVRELVVGPDNDGYVVIEEGLLAGEQIALNPDLIWEDVAGDELALPAESSESTDSGERAVAVTR